MAENEYVFCYFYTIFRKLENDSSIKFLILFNLK